jgi:hypothetical protein
MFRGVRGATIGSREKATYIEVFHIVTIQLLVFRLLVLGILMTSFCNHLQPFQFHILICVHLIASLQLSERIVVDVIDEAK